MTHSGSSPGTHTPMLPVVFSGISGISIPYIICHKSESSCHACWRELHKKTKRRILFSSLWKFLLNLNIITWQSWKWWQTAPRLMTSMIGFSVCLFSLLFLFLSLLLLLLLFFEKWHMVGLYHNFEVFCCWQVWVPRGWWLKSKCCTVNPVPNKLQIILLHICSNCLMLQWKTAIHYEKECLCGEEHKHHKCQNTLDFWW